MIFFKSNKIFLDSETVAEQLRRARQAKKLKLEDVAIKLNINHKYLKALEKGEFDKLPKGIYGKNFLREYCLFLGLNDKELIEAYDAEKNILQPKTAKELFSNQVVKKRYLWTAPKIINNILIAIVIIICFIYLGFRLNKIILPPELYLYNPPDNLITTKNVIDISGKTESEAHIIINGEPVLSDTSGNFTKTINLKVGINTITITANKKYGRSNTIIRQILVKNQ